MSPETRSRRWRVRLATWGGAVLAALVVCAAPAAAQAPVRLAGTNVVGSPGSSAQPGGAEVYRTTASASGTARYISLFLDQASTADRVVVGLYADEGGQPTSLLTTGSMAAPMAGDWNHIAVAETSVVSGRAYWIAMLNPADSTGTLAWRDRAGGTGGAEQTSARGDLTALPAEWETGSLFSDGPLSAYVSDRDPGAPLGLVGAWSFDETSGSTAGDASGFGNAGMITGATRAAGRYGNGLRFDGVDDWVTVDDDDTLDISDGMTLEAWVRPDTVGTNWQTVLLKEQASSLAYALYGNTDGGVPAGHVFTDGDVAVRGPVSLPANQWSHLATTWDGATLRLYVNATEVASAPLVGTATQSDGALRIGGNEIWPEYFDGMIDEVRVYDRALTPAEIATDRDTRIGAGGGQPPQGDKYAWLRRLIRYVIHRWKKHHGHSFSDHWLGYDGKPRWQDRADAYQWLSDALRRWAN